VLAVEVVISEPEDSGGKGTGDDDGYGEEVNIAGEVLVNLMVAHCAPASPI
jgi:hypothetical protein